MGAHLAESALNVVRGGAGSTYSMGWTGNASEFEGQLTVMLPSLFLHSAKITKGRPN